MAHSIKIGFYKSAQGAFTEEVINIIKKNVSELAGIELVEVDFRRGVLINGKVYVDKICLNDFDIYFWHDTLWPSKTGSDSYYINLLKTLETDTLVINSAQSTEITNDKLKSHQKLVNAGLPVSEFALIFSDNQDSLAKAFSDLGEDVLIKPRFGGWGKGIVRIRSVSDLKDYIELVCSYSQKSEQFLLERFYENDPEGWVSVSMINGEAIIGYKKSLNVGGSSWKVYDPDKIDGRGEFSEYVRPNNELVSYSKAAQAAIGKDIIGFDFIKTNKGYKIVDENGRPGLYEHCLISANINLAEVITDLIKSKVEILKNRQKSKKVI